MISYFYWLIIIMLALAALYVVGHNNEQWKVASAIAATVMFVGYLAFYFHFQQLFVKRYGGHMSVSIAEGEMHIMSTWKGDNLWIENYDPRSGECRFREYSRGNMLEGVVVIKNCNPLILHK